jgi:hypothetical protein
MGALGVRHVRLWPRFHVKEREALEARPGRPEVIELSRPSRPRWSPADLSLAELRKTA